MRIAFLGNFGIFYTTENHHALSLESLGHEVVRMQETQTTKERLLEEGLKSDLVVAIHTHGWQTPGLLTWQFISDSFREAGVPFITYHLDLWLGLEREGDLLSEPFYASLHHFFTVDKLMADWLNKNTETKGHYLPAGVYDKECIMLRPQRVNYDIVFTGSKKYHTEHPFRPQLIEFLYKTYGRKFVHIGNDGEIGQKRGMDLNQIYRNAKIVVGDSLQKNFDYPYYWSDRAYEVPGRSGCSVFPDIKGIEDNYIDGEEIILYKHGDLNNLKEKIDYYLSHESEREAIRLAGFERTKQDHTYVKRWEKILEVLNEGSISD